MARTTNISPLHRYAKMLETHADGICAYPQFKLTITRIEAGNVAASMIRNASKRR